MGPRRPVLPSNSRPAAPLESNLGKFADGLAAEVGEELCVFAPAELGLNLGHGGRDSHETQNLWETGGNRAFTRRRVRY